MYTIIDGSKRLETIEQFYQGKLTLTGLELLVNLEGLNWETIHPKYQRRILFTPIRTHVIRRGCSTRAYQSICERLKP